MLRCADEKQEIAFSLERPSGCVNYSDGLSLLYRLCLPFTLMSIPPVILAVKVLVKTVIVFI